MFCRAAPSWLGCNSDCMGAPSKASSLRPASSHKAWLVCSISPCASAATNTSDMDDSNP